MMAVVLSHDLNEEMIAKLGQECPPEPVVAAFAAKIKANSAAAAKDVFGAYGSRLMQRALELGEEYPDQTYEVLKAAAKKTGRLYFPHVAQRFLEIAYLATQPIATVDIVENNHYRLVNRMGPFCAVYKTIKQACGDDVAATVPCRHACLSALNGLYEALKLDVAVTQEAEMGKDGQCRFAASNNRPHEPTPWRR